MSTSTTDSPDPFASVQIPDEPAAYNENDGTLIEAAQRSLIDNLFEALPDTTPAPPEIPDPEEVLAADAEEGEEEEEEGAAEAAPEAPAEEPQAGAEDPKMLERLERVAAQERALSQTRREIDTARQQLVEQQQQLQARSAEVEKFQALVEKFYAGDPLEALHAAGIDAKAFVTAVANGVGVNPNKKQEDRLERLERQIREREEAERAYAAQAETARRVETARGHIRATIEQEDPVLAALGDDGVGLVYALAEQERAAGRTATYDTVFEKARNDVFSLVDRLAAVPAIRARLGLTDGDSEQSEPRAASKTVSNKAAKTPAPRKPVRAPTEMTDEEIAASFFG